MKSKRFIFSKVVSVFFFLILFASCKKEVASVSKTSSPNIIYILADDLGYGDVGAYGQTKIETSNIDALAKQGMLFTQHYSSAPVCAPSRYMLMTGLHSGHAYIRGNDPWSSRGDVLNYLAMAKDSTLEGQRPMEENTITFPMKLQEKGYKTAIYGKWGLGAPHTHSIPTRMGFDEFYGYNCQRQAHTYYPLHLYENEHRVHLNNDTIVPSRKLNKDADPLVVSSYEDYSLNEYAPDLMFDALTSFIDRNKENPFFVYWATPLPHMPLQAPKEWVDYYIEKFGDEAPYVGGKGYYPNRNPRATYAAMISYLDSNVGKLIDQLKKEGLYDNTLIVFTSDNGPTYNGGTDTEWFDSAKPFDGSYGRGKGFVFEGGVRIPMIASWPNRIAKGSASDHVSVQYDVFDTMNDIVGFNESPKTDGVSFLPTLLQEETQEKHSFLYWEFPEYGGQVAIRMGDWKVIWKDLKNNKKTSTVSVYNLDNDPKEENDVANESPEIIKKAFEIYKMEHSESEFERFKLQLTRDNAFNTGISS
ncbi:arylsulfatase [Joostella atrarenae]|uniref:Arylsulfatase n=1 Tax=Joostella atrarenae TaxID=679257 RepID=A0ABS9J5B3_9FLAO|nr:arylsulfatase [Joostella atrarenae]MCF8715622.1 arylsulfatase [Joostella atrarenae]